MKKTSIILAILLALLAFTSCHKDKEFGSEKPEIGEVEVMPSLNHADFTWKVEYPGKFQTGVEIGANKDLVDSRIVEGTKDGDLFKASISQLEASTKYYYRIVVWNKMSRQEGEVKSFTTLTPDPEPDVYTITVSANPEEGGTVTGGGEYVSDSTCTVKAIANEGYTFVNWTENNVQVSGDAEYAFPVTGNRNLVANFTSQAYIIQVQVDPEDGGTVEGAGGYNYNDECTLTATPNEGYDFVNWTKGDTEISTESSITFNVTESATYVAHFQKKSYTVEVSANPTEGGTVSGGGIYSYDDLCVVTAMVNEGYQFVNWTENGGQVSGLAEYTFTVTDNRQLLANFTSQAYLIQVQIDPEEGGTVEGAGGYDYGQECTLKAIANEGYDFVNWTKEDGTQVSTEATYRFSVTESATYVAHFQIQSYNIEVSANPVEGGTVSGGGMFNYGENCTLTATANTGYVFHHWTQNGATISGGATINFTVTANATYVAYFTQQTYTITTQSNPSNGGSVSGGGNYTYGQNCTLTATANTGYVFHHWTQNGATISGGATINFTVTANATYVAYFTQQTYTITTQSNPSDGGTVSGGGTYNQGASCTVHAQAATNYQFTNWTEGGTVVSTQANYQFTVNSNRTLVANFQQQTTDQTFTVNGVSFTMKRVEGGTFWMGAQSTDPNGQNYDSEACGEDPVHSVTLSTFYMGETEVTQELWQAVMGSNPSYFSGTNLPVEMVSWNMIVNEFLPALNAATGRNFRLPTEAEWEYAARGGNQGHGYKYAGSNTIGNVAWYIDNSNNQTHSVATKSPNELGLYDMSGNVYEWCSDWYSDYSSSSQTNPTGPLSGSHRVLRGGSWYYGASYCRVSHRNFSDPYDWDSNDGFRLCLPQ